jgi:hypothetical protein
MVVVPIVASLLMVLGVAHATASVECPSVSTGCVGTGLLLQAQTSKACNIRYIAHIRFCECLREGYCSKHIQA